MNPFGALTLLCETLLTKGRVDMAERNMWKRRALKVAQAMMDAYKISPEEESGDADDMIATSFMAFMTVVEAFVHEQFLNDKGEIDLSTMEQSKRLALKLVTELLSIYEKNEIQNQ